MLQPQGFPLGTGAATNNLSGSMFSYSDSSLGPLQYEGVLTNALQLIANFVQGRVIS